MTFQLSTTHTNPVNFNWQVMYHNNIAQYDFSVSDTGELTWKNLVLSIDIKSMTFWLIVQATFVQKVDSTIHWINHYPVVFVLII